MSDRAILLIDGENLLLRYEAMISAGHKPKTNTVYKKDGYVWNPGITQVFRFEAVRVSYYTTKVGDEVSLTELKRDLSKLSYIYASVAGDMGEGRINPRVYKKQEKSRKTKSVDINITIDALRHTHNDSVDIVYLLTGDGDYLPLVEEIMRHGKRVWVGAFSDGAHPDFLHASDDYVDLDEIFFEDEKPTDS